MQGKLKRVFTPYPSKSQQTGPALQSNTEESSAVRCPVLPTMLGTRKSPFTRAADPLTHAFSSCMQWWRPVHAAGCSQAIDTLHAFDLWTLLGSRWSQSLGQSAEMHPAGCRGPGLEITLLNLTLAGSDPGLLIGLPWGPKSFIWKMRHADQSEEYALSQLLKPEGKWKERRERREEEV